MALAVLALTPPAAVAATALAALDRSGRRALAVARWWARAVLAAAGVRLRVVDAGGRETDRPVVVLANHESYLDVPALLVALPSELDLRFLAKRSLFRVPLFGWAIRAMGFVPVDRVRRRRAVAAFEAGAGHLARGRSLAIFPEERRARGPELLPLQRGGFLLALRAGAPIVPVGIEGTARVLRPGSLRVRPGTVTVRIGEPIPTAGLGVAARRELQARVRAELERLRGPRGGRE